MDKNYYYLNRIHICTRIGVYGDSFFSEPPRRKEKEPREKLTREYLKNILLDIIGCPLVRDMFYVLESPLGCARDTRPSRSIRFIFFSDILLEIFLLFYYYLKNVKKISIFLKRFLTGRTYRVDATVKIIYSIENTHRVPIDE